MTSRGLAVAVALCACAGFQPTVKQDPAPSLPLPQRPASAPGGTAFAEARPASVWPSGHAAAVEQILAGIVPSWVRRLTPVTLRTAQATATIHVIPDYIAIGS